jgi:hypothetical protein
LTLLDSENVNRALRAAIAELEQAGRQVDAELTDVKARLNHKTLETLLYEKKFQDLAYDLAQKDAQVAAAARCVVCGVWRMVRQGEWQRGNFSNIALRCCCTGKAKMCAARNASGTGVNLNKHSIEFLSF